MPIDYITFLELYILKSINVSSMLATPLMYTMDHNNLESKKKKEEEETANHS